MSCIVLSKLIYCRGCDWWMTIWHVGHVCFSSKCLTRQLLQKVWRHSVTVVASIRYPRHILHVMWLFNVFSFIRLSMAPVSTIYSISSFFFLSPVINPDSDNKTNRLGFVISEVYRTNYGARSSKTSVYYVQSRSIRIKNSSGLQVSRRID